MANIEDLPPLDTGGEKCPACGVSTCWGECGMEVQDE